MNNATTSQISKLKLNLEAPLMRDLEVEFNKLSIFAGQNASGKSFILKSAFYISELAAVISTAKQLLNTKATPEFINGLSTMLLKNVFESCEEITGDIEGTWGPCSLSASILKGEVQSVSYVNPDELKNVPQIRYMSTNIRLFSDIKRYLQLRNTQKDKNSLDESINHMLNFYKLYDVKDVENLIHKTTEEYEVPAEVNDLINSTEPGKEMLIKSIKVDLTECDFIITYVDGSKRNASTLSNGIQAILHMFLSIN